MKMANDNLGYVLLFFIFLIIQCSATTTEVPGSSTTSAPTETVVDNTTELQTTKGVTHTATTVDMTTDLSTHENNDSLSVSTSNISFNATNSVLPTVDLTTETSTAGNNVTTSLSARNDLFNATDGISPTDVMTTETSASGNDVTTSLSASNTTDGNPPTDIMTTETSTSGNGVTTGVSASNDSSYTTDGISPTTAHLTTESSTAKTNGTTGISLINETSNATVGISSTVHLTTESSTSGYNVTTGVSSSNESSNATVGVSTTVNLTTETSTVGNEVTTGVSSSNDSSNTIASVSSTVTMPTETSTSENDITTPDSAISESSNATDGVSSITDLTTEANTVDVTTSIKLPNVTDDVKTNTNDVSTSEAMSSPEITISTTAKISGSSTASDADTSTVSMTTDQTKTVSEAVKTTTLNVENSTEINDDGDPTVVMTSTVSAITTDFSDGTATIMTTEYSPSATGYSEINETTTILPPTTSPSGTKGTECSQMDLSECFDLITKRVINVTSAVTSRGRVTKGACRNVTELEDCGEKLTKCSERLSSYHYLFRSVLVSICSGEESSNVSNEEENEDSDSDDDENDSSSEESSENDSSNDKMGKERKIKNNGYRVKGEDKEFCDIAVAGQCLSEFLRLLPHNSVSSICRQASWSVKCMKSAVQGCLARQRNIFSLLATRVTMTQNRLCGSRSCQMDMSIGCMKEADMASAQLHKNPDLAIFLCRKLKAALACVYNHTSECDFKEDNSNLTTVMKKLKSHQSVIPRMCTMQTKHTDFEDWWEVSDELAFGVFLDSPYAHREAVCRTVKKSREEQYGIWSGEKTEEENRSKQRTQSELAEERSEEERSRSKVNGDTKSAINKVTKMHGYLSDRNMLHHVVGDYCDEDEKNKVKCKEESVTTTTQSPCNYQAALDCISEYNIPGRLVSVFFGDSAEELCKNVYEMLLCVHQNVHTCDLPQKKMVKDSVNSVMTLVGNHCPRPTFPTPTENPCTVKSTKCQAEKDTDTCIDKYSEEDSSEICRMYNKTVECVQGHTKLCYSLQSTVSVYRLQVLGDEVMCPSSIGVLPRDDHTKLARCSLDFAHLVHNALISNNQISRQMCMALKAFRLCCAGLKVPAITKLYLKKSQLLINDFEAGNCVMEDEEEVTTAKTVNDTIKITTTTPAPPKEPRSCDKWAAAKCFSQHLIKLLGRSFLTLSDRTHICSEAFSVERCTRQHTATCSVGYQTSLKAPLGLWQYVHRKVCLSQRTLIPELKQCDPDVALLCLQYFGEAVSKASMQDLDHTCSELNYTLSCLHMTADDCEGDRLEDVNASLSVVQNMIGNSCPELSDALLCKTRIIAHDTNMTRNTTGNGTEHGVEVTVCKVLPVCSLEWDSCIPAMDSAAVCGNTTVAECITNMISGCDTSLLLHGHHKLQSIQAQLAVGNEGSCELNIEFPDDFESDKATNNCTEEFYTDLERNYLLLKEANNRVLCGIFTTLFTCLENQSVMAPVVMQRIMGNVGKYILDESGIFCQPEPTTPAPTVSPTQECREVPVDLVFLLDESGSVTLNNFLMQLEFVKELVKSPRLSSSIKSGALRIGTVTFATNPRNIFNLNKHDNVEAILKSIDEVNYLRGGTYIGRALQFVGQNSFIAASGTRKEAPKILIIMTDGKSSDDGKAKAEALRQNDVFILVIAIGKGVDYEQLYEIATDGKKNVYGVDNFDKLQNFTNTFMEVIPCPEDPLTCDAIGGIRCYKKQSMGMFTGLLPLSQRSSVCSMTREYTECVSNLTSTCGKTKMNKFSTLSELTQKTIEHQNICKLSSGVQGKCLTQKALSCLGSLTRAVTLHHNTPAKSAICSRIQSTENCVVNNIIGCPKHVKEAITGTYTDLQTIARQACMGRQPRSRAPDDCDYLQGDRSSMCDATEAVNCLISLRANYMASEKPLKSLCSYIPNTKQCIMKHISGCEKYERDNVKVMFHSLLKKVAGKCVEINCDTCGALQCMEGQTSLLVKNHPYLCMEMENTKRCVTEKVKHCKKDVADFVNKKMKELLEKSEQKCRLTMQHCLASFEKTAWGILRYKSGLIKQKPIEGHKDEFNRTNDGSSESIESGSSSQMSDEFGDFIGGWDKSEEEFYDEDKLSCEEDLDRETKNILLVHRRNLQQIKGRINTEKSPKSSEQEGEVKKMYGENTKSNDQLKGSSENISHPRNATDTNTRQCRTRLGWKCEKARIYFECVLGSLYFLPRDRQSILHSSLKAVWESLQHKCTARGMQCFNCQNAVSNQKCNSNAVTSCSAKQQACQTIVDNESGHVTKGCVNPNVCKTQCTSNKKKCSVCCYGNLCNQPLDTVIEEPKSCKGASAVKCAFSVMFATVSFNESQCSTIQKKFDCMTLHTKACIGGQYRGIAKHVHAMEKSAVITNCHLKQLHCNCGLCGTMSLGITIQNPFRDNMKVCSQLKHTVYGASLATNENYCTDFDFKATFFSLTLAGSVIGDTCLPSNDDLTMMSSVKTKDKASVTPVSNITTSEESNESCDEKTLMECVEKSLLQQELLLTTISKNFSRVCSIAEGMASCIQARNESCSDEVISSVNATLSKTLGLVKGHCNVNEATEQYSECSISAAKQCLHSLMMSSNTSEQLCTKSDEVVDCLNNNTMGCYSIQKVPVLYLVKHLKNTLQGICNMTYHSGPSDIYHNLSKCVLDYTNAMHHSLTTVGPETKMMICESTAKLQGCLYEDALPPLAKLYLQNILHVSYDLMNIACPAFHEYEKKPLYCYRCRKESSDTCHSHGKVSICDRKSESCWSVGMYSDNNDLVYNKGCTPKALCNKTESCDGQINCSYCCNDDFCNNRGQTFITKSTVQPQVPTEEPACSYSVADIAFLLDSSSSIGTEDYSIMLRFVASLVDQMNVGPDDVHVSLAVFAESVTTKFNFNSYDNKTEMLAYINSMEYNKETGTNLAAGLELARTQLFTEANGDRPQVTDAVVLLTDGKFSGTDSEVQEFRNVGITILAVGIGDSVHQPQLQGVASKPEYVFTVDSFSVLNTIKSRLLHNIPCPEAPATCMLGKASVCINSLLSSLVIMPFIPLSQRPVICSEMSEIDSCTDKSLTNCPASNIQQFQKLSAWIHHKGSYICKYGFPNIENEDEVKPKLSCDDIAKQCLAPTFRQLTFKVEDSTQLCSTLNRSISCLSESFTSCSFDNIVKSLQLVIGIVGNICGKEATLLCELANLDRNCSLPARTCSLSTVLNQIQLYKESYDEDPGDVLLCFESGTEASDTVSRSIEGCTSLQFYQAKYSFYNVIETLECELSPMVKTPIDLLDNVTECASTFTTNVESVIKSPEKGVDDLCPVTKKFTDCLNEYVRTLPQSVRGLFILTNATHTVLNDFEKDDCQKGGPNVTVADEPEGCKLSTAITCANTLFLQSAFIGFHRMSDRMVFCREQRFLKTCVKDSSAKCSTTRRSQIMRMLEISEDMMNRTQICRNDTVMESEEEEAPAAEDNGHSCSTDKAWECISQLGHNISYYATSLADEAICSVANHTRFCVGGHLRNCTEKATRSVKGTLSNVESNALRMCHNDKIKEDITSPPRCVDPKYEYPKSVCKPSVAMKCTLQLLHETFNPFTTQDRLCVKYAWSLQCFYKHANPCEGYLRSSLHKYLVYSLHLVNMRGCEVEIKSPCVMPPLPSNCTIHRAVMCVNKLRTLISKSLGPKYQDNMEGNKDANRTWICGNITEVQQCIQVNKADCQANDVYRVIEKFHSLRQVVGDLCDVRKKYNVHACIHDFSMKAATILKYSSRLMTGDSKGHGKNDTSRKDEDINKRGNKEKESERESDNSEESSRGSSESEERKKRSTESNKDSWNNSNTTRQSDRESTQHFMKLQRYKFNIYGKMQKGYSSKKLLIHKMQYICYEVEAAWKCIQDKLKELSYHRRTILNMILQATYRAVKYRCKPQTCYSCFGLKDNTLCNKQGVQLCLPGEVCSASVNKVGIMKGCVSHNYCNSTCSGQRCNYCCQGHLCNREASVRKARQCNIAKAITCSIEVVSLVARSNTITERLLSKSLTCMETHSGDCLSDHLIILKTTAIKIRRLLAVSSCIREPVMYQHCGSVAVLSLSKIATSVLATTDTVCRMMNSTVNLLDRMQTSGVCFPEEMRHVQDSLGYVKSKFIGDRCSKNDKGKTELKCRAHSVLQSCLGLTHITAISGISRLNQTCREMEVNETLQCIVNYTSGCFSTEMAGIEPEIRDFVSRAVKMCNLSMEQILLPYTKFLRRSDDYNEVAACVSFFGKKLVNVLNNGSGKKSVCEVYTVTVSCVRKAKIPALLKSLGRGVLNLLGNSYDSICVGNKSNSTEGSKISNSSSVANSTSTEISVMSGSTESTTRSPEIRNETTTDHCDLHVTPVLIVHHSLILFTSPMSSTATVRSTCSVYIKVEEYVKKEMNTCSSPRYQDTVGTAIKFFHQAARDVCVSMVTKDDENKEKDETCPVLEVERCFSNLVPHLLSMASPQKQFCMEMNSVLDCVSSYECDSKEVGHVTEALSIVGHIGGQRCPELRNYTQLDYDMADMCSMEATFACLKQLKPNSTGCSNLADVYTCILANMTGCSELQRSGFKQLILTLKKKQVPKCLDVSLALLPNTRIEPSEILLKHCLEHFNQETQSKLSSDLQLANHWTCDSFESLADCIGNVSESKNGFIVKQLLGNMLPAFYELVKICKQESISFVHSGKCPILEHDQVGTCIVECVQDSDCAWNERCCSNGCGYTCVTTVQEGNTSTSSNETSKDECDLARASSCVISAIATGLVAPFYNHGDKKAVCHKMGIASELHNCVHNNSQGCQVHKQQHLKMLTQLAKTILVQSGVCWNSFLTCDAATSLECIADLGTHISSTTSMIVKRNNDSICSTYEKSKQCVVHNLYGCTDAVRYSARTTFQETQCLMEGLCPVMQEPTVVDEEPPQCVDESVATARTICSQHDAVGCFNDVRILRANPFISLKNVCYAYGKSLQCYVNNMYKCDVTLKHMTRTVLKELSPLDDRCKTTLKPTCKTVEDKCNVQEMEKCIDMVKNVLISSFEDGEVCILITEAWECIKQKSNHCSALKIQSVQKKLTNILNDFEIDCGDSLEVCYYRFRDNTLDILKRHKTTEVSVGDESLENESNSYESSERTDREKRDTKTKSKEKSREYESTVVPTSKTTKATPNPTAKAPQSSQDNDDTFEKERVCLGLEEATACIKTKIATSSLKAVIMQSMESSLEMLYILAWEECQGLACYTCRNSASNADCNANGKVYCSSNKQACKTVVNNGVITKGCMKPDTCAKTCGIGKPCQCCYGYMCNEPGVQVYYDPPSCNVYTIGMRVLKFVTQIVDNFDRSPVINCSMIEIFLNELSNVTATCSKRLLNHVTAMRTSLSVVRESVCRVPMTCNKAKAKSCIEHLNYTVQNNVSHACSTHGVTMQCLSEVYVTCSQQEKSTMQSQLKAVFGDINCQTMPPFSFSSTTDVISILEGGSSKYIHLKMMESPKQKCKGSSCRILVTVTLEHQTDADSRICPDGTVIPQLIIGDQNTAGFCSLTFTTKNWDRNISIPLTAVMDGLYDGTQQLKLNVTAAMYEDDKVVLERLLASYTVLVLDNDKRRSICTSINDPHMKTFDGLYYNNMNEGEFILYRNSLYSQEARVVFKKCWKASCNCAINIKVEDDYLRLDMCNPRIKIPTIVIYKNNNLTAGFRVFGLPGGTRSAAYKVVLKTGTEVIIRIISGLINVLISPSSADVGRVQGLCGNFDGDVTNDLVLPNGELYEVEAKYLVANRRNSRDTLTPRGFNVAWRVEENDMWFLDQYDRTVYPYTNIVYCSCPLSAKDSSDTCRSLLPATKCPEQKGVDLFSKGKTFVKNGLPTVSGKVTRRRRKRQVADTNDLASLGINLKAEPQQVDFPVGNWTEEKARQFCESYIKESAVGQSCGQVTAIDESEITGCIEDIKLSGDTSFADSAKDAMQSKCQDEIKKDTKYTTDPNARKVAETVSTQTCENNCNNNGVCVNDTCRCFSNYIGPSCSMGLTEAPVIARLGEDICDFRTDPQCDSVSVYGEKFVDLSTLTCHYKNLQWVENKWEETGQTFKSNAVYISFNLVECNLPAGVATKTLLRGASVFVSNNGINLSDGDFRFIAHDSQCYSCSAASCQTTMNGCVINNICYIKGDVSSDNPCHFCDPVTSTTEWTVKLASYCPTTPTPTTTTTTSTPTSTSTEEQTTQIQDDAATVEEKSVAAVAATSTVAGVALLALIALAVVFLRYRRGIKNKNKQMRRYESGSDNSIEDRRQTYDNYAYNHAYNNAYQYDYRPWYRTDPREVFAYQIPKRHKQHASRDPTNNHKESKG